ncbi:MAG: hypothetical protein ACOC34_03345 [Thermotogota bacterium]
MKKLRKMDFELIEKTNTKNKLKQIEDKKPILEEFLSTVVIDG